MADLTKTIEVVFGAVDHIGPTATSLGSKFDGLNASMQSVVQPISAAIDGLLKIEAAVAALGAALLAFSVGAAKDFEAGFLDLKKVLDDSEDDYEGYKGQIRDLALTYGVLSGEVTRAVADFVSSGQSISQAMGLTDIALQATKASTLGAADAAQIALAQMRGFGLGVSDMTHVFDAFNEVENQTAAKFDQLGEAMKILAPIGKQVGLTFDEMLAYVTPVVEQFQSGSVAGDALRTIMLRLLDPTKETVDAMQKLGLSLLDSTGYAKPFKDTMAELGQLWPTLTEQQRGFALSQLAGKERAAEFATVMGNLNRITEVYNITQNSANSLAHEVAIRMESAKEKFAQASVAIEQASIALGDKFLEATKGTASGVSALGLALRDLIEQGKFDPLLDAIRPAMTELNRLIESIATNLPEAMEGVDFSAITRALGDLGDEIKAVLVDLIGDVDLTTVEGLRQALQTTVNLFASLIDFTRGLLQGFEPVFKLLGEAAKQSGNAAGETAVEFGRLAAIPEMLAHLGVSATALIASMQAFGAGATNTFNTVAGAAGVLKNILDVAWNGILVGLSALGSAFYETLNVLTLGTMTSVQDQAALFRAKMSEHFEAIGRNAKEGGESFAQLLSGLNGEESTRAASNLGKISDTAGQVAEGAAKARTPMQQLIDELNSGRVDQFTEAWNGLNVTVLNGVPVIGRNRQEMEELRQDLAAVEALYGKIIPAFDEATARVTKTTEAYKGQNQVLTDANGNIKIVAKSVDELAEKQKKHAEETDKAKQKAQEFQEKMEQIASNERIKKFDIAVNFQIEKLRADSAQVIAIVNATTATIESSGKVIASIFDALGKVGGFYGLEQLEIIRRQLDIENQLRREAFEQQKKLAEAQIAYLRAKAEAIGRGDALIKITADGLEPELDAFMWKILKKVQTRATEEGQKYLLMGLA